MTDTPAVPAVFDEDAIAEDLTHHPPVARNALDLFRREVADQRHNAESA